jgi:hypothetical protein
MASKMRVRFLFKSGESEEVNCESIKVRMIDGEMSGYDIDGMDHETQLLYVHIKDVVCVRRVK